MKKNSTINRINHSINCSAESVGQSFKFLFFQHFKQQWSNQELYTLFESYPLPQKRPTQNNWSQIKHKTIKFLWAWTLKTSKCYVQLICCLE